MCLGRLVLWSIKAVSAASHAHLQDVLGGMNAVAEYLAIAGASKVCEGVRVCVQATETLPRT